MMAKAASARGLFRATGKKGKPVAVRAESDLSGDIVRAEYLAREKNDFYPTPPDPTRAFLSAEIGRLRDFPVIWEPAVGDGAIARELEAVGLTVFGSDLVQRGAADRVDSFYAFRRSSHRAIVTNPPFAECNCDPGWVRHAMQTLGVEYMALLLPIAWVGAASRAKLWADYPPARIYIMRWRIDFTGQGASPVLNAWFVWDCAFLGETVLRMLDRTDARQSELFKPL